MLFAALGSRRVGKAMDFRTFVRILLAHWKLAMSALLMCTIGAAAITAVQTKHYQSSTTVLISFSRRYRLDRVVQRHADRTGAVVVVRPDRRRTHRR